ncbi:MAG TPA: hypothetical protein VK943_01815 [Arenibaculum sp.]|nr:hypothetical protein [Arenibaculum sp.]
MAFGNAMIPALSAATLLWMMAGATDVAAQTADADEPEITVEPAATDPGFKLIVIGRIPGTEDAAFGDAVASALPERLVDPGANFTAHPAYEEGLAYRLVMIFHGSREVDATDICRQRSNVDVEPPAPPDDLMAETRVTAAFCAGEETLGTAADRMVGSVEPGQAGFRFLVSDVVKQLFPDGFDTIPGSLGASAPIATPE